MKFYIIAGERSGDLHGSNLIKALLQLNPQSAFRGFGGDEMQKMGAHLVMHYNQLAFMGFQAVINFFKISRYMKTCKADILAYQPDALILIDYGGFNRKMATFGKMNNIKVFYYIPPKVWAWRQSRAWQLKKNVDHMFVILPFEKEFYKKYDFGILGERDDRGGAGGKMQGERAGGRPAGDEAERVTVEGQHPLDPAGDEGEGAEDEGGGHRAKSCTLSGGSNRRGVQCAEVRSPGLSSGWKSALLAAFM